MSKTTPGPWGTTTRQGSWDWVVFSKADPNIEICQMFHDDTEFNETGEANSRLVAAAPDMLALLLVMREAYEDQPIVAWKGAINAIIAKAGG